MNGYHDGAYGHLYIMVPKLDPDDPGLKEEPNFLGMTHRPEIKEDVLTLSGESPYVLPFTMCEWLAVRYGVKVEFWSSEEHSRHSDGWYQSNGDCWMENDYEATCCLPVKEWFTRDGVDCKHHDDLELSSQREQRRRQIVLAETLVLPEVLAALPEVDAAWFQRPLDDRIIQARLFGNYDSHSPDEIQKRGFRVGAPGSVESLATQIAEIAGGVPGHADLEYGIGPK